MLKSASLLDLLSQQQRTLTENNMNTETSKERLPQGLFEALSKSMDADEPIKGLMTKTLNLMIEAEFEVKIGAKKSEQTPARKRSSDGTKLYRCGYRTRRFDTTCGTLMLKIPHPNKGDSFLHS